MSIRVAVIPGSRLTFAEIKEHWKLRIEVLRLKPTTDIDKDFSQFSKIIERSYVLSFRDTSGVCGLMAFELERITNHQGNQALVLLPEYAALRRHLRGSAVVMRGYLKLLARLLEPGDLFRTWYVLGAGYPSSFLAIERLCRHAWVDGEPMPAFERELMERFKTRELKDKMDPVTGVVSMPTIPPPLRSELNSTEALARYEARNPNWADGYGLVVLAKADVRAVKQVIGRLFLRSSPRNSTPVGVGR